MAVATGILLVLTSCADPDQEDSFNRWYDHAHIPDVIATGLILGARRFVSLGAGQPAGAKYLALYETATADPHDALRMLGREWVPRWQGEGRMHHALVIVLATTYRRRSGSVAMPGSGDLVLMMGGGREDVGDELEDWYTRVHVPEARTRSVFGAVSLYRNTTPHRGGGAFLTLYDTTDPIEGLRILVDDLLPTRTARHDISPLLGTTRTAAFHRIF